MMGLLDTLKGMFGGKGVQLPENLDTPQEILEQGKQLVADNADKLDAVTDKIPGQVDNQVVDTIKQKIQ